MSSLTSVSWLLILLTLVSAVMSAQEVFSADDVAEAKSASGQHQLALDTRWKVLGPLPAGMRESHVGAFSPLAFRPIQSIFDDSVKDVVFSTLIPGAEAGLQIFEAKSEGKTKGTVRHSLHLQYPDADWHGVQSTMGWAAVQWQALCTSRLKVSHGKGGHVSLRATAPAAASFAFVSEEKYRNGSFVDEVQWYNGDWYSYTGQDQASATLSHWLTLPSGEYYVLVKAVHEVRIHGAGEGDAGPAIEFKFELEAVGSGEEGEEQSDPLLILPDRTIVPDIVSGNFAGFGIGLAIQNFGSSTLRVDGVEIIGDAAKFLEAKKSENSIDFAAGQIRPVKVEIRQMEMIPAAISTILVEMSYTVNHEARRTLIDVSVEHVGAPEERSCEKSELSSWTFTYLDADGTIQAAAAVPPLRLFKETNSIQKPTPMTLYLHGAGVKIQWRTSQQVLRRQCESWIVLPSGRTPWGTDWQGLSRDSVNFAAEQFKSNMYGFSAQEKERLRIPSTERYMLVGHSNGGQGVYHYASHWPDKVIGAVVAAGYIRMADYVPFLWQRSRHFVDAALEGILRSSLNPYENNLFASNLAGLPITIKHGGADDNVPTWHSREMAGLVADWNRNSAIGEDTLVHYSEIPGKPHFWDGMLQEKDVQDAIDARVTERRNPGYAGTPQLSTFTLTVSNPAESGSKQGWRIIRLPIAGRLGRLTIHYIGGIRKQIHVRTSNVDSVTFVPSESVNTFDIIIDGHAIGSSDVSAAYSDNQPLHFKKLDGESWQVATQSAASSVQASDRALGPSIRFLQSYGGPIQIVVPRARCRQETTARYMSIARRFSNDAFIYNGIDSVILFDDEISGKTDGSLLGSSKLGLGNILILGGPSVNVLAFFAAAKQELFKFEEDSPYFSAKGASYGEGYAMMALMPDPLDEAAREESRESHSHNSMLQASSRMTLMIHGTTSGSVEQGAFLLPLRTGSMLPEWVVIEAHSPDSRAPQWKGYGSIVAAGWYDYYWGYSSTMSYFL